MAEAGIYYVPTLSLTHLNRGPDYAATELERDPSLAHSIPEPYRLRAVEAAAAHADGFRKALSSGVKIACGSDLSLPDGALFEMGMLVRCGMSEWQAIVAATKMAAEVCCVSNEYGTVEPGKRVDLVVLASNPLDNIDSVRDVVAVIKDVKLVRSRA